MAKNIGIYARFVRFFQFVANMQHGKTLRGGNVDNFVILIHATLLGPNFRDSKERLMWAEGPYEVYSTIALRNVSAKLITDEERKGSRLPIEACRGIFSSIDDHMLNQYRAEWASDTNKAIATLNVYLFESDPVHDPMERGVILFDRYKVENGWKHMNPSLQDLLLSFATVSELQARDIGDGPLVLAASSNELQCQFLQERGFLECVADAGEIARQCNRLEIRMPNKVRMYAASDATLRWAANSLLKAKYEKGVSGTKAQEDSSGVTRLVKTKAPIFVPRTDCETYSEADGCRLDFFRDVIEDLAQGGGDGILNDSGVKLAKAI